MDKIEAVDILIVEDNPNDAELMIRALKKSKIANPIHVLENGEDALNFIFSRGKYADRGGLKQPKVILLDIKLPKVSGLEILKTIKANGKTKKIPVVIVTSSSEDPDVRSAYSLGANSYIVKSVDSTAFINCMSSLGMYWLMLNQPPV